MRYLRPSATLRCRTDVSHGPALAGIGVDYMQGYAIDRPVPIDDYFAVASRWIAGPSPGSVAVAAAVPAPRP